MIIAQHRQWPTAPARPIQPVEPKQIFIGLDFGTTFTKVSYRITPALNWRIKTVVFPGEEEECLRPSVVWIGPDDNGTEWLQFEEPADPDTAMVPVRYFKYSMVLSGLTQTPEVDDAIKGTNNGLRVFSAFFLGLLLHDIKDEILKVEHLKPDEVQWFVNLGIPAGTSGPDADFSPTVSDQHVLDVFTEVLNVAWNLSLTDYAADGGMSLADMDRFYEETKTERDSTHLNCVPELYAEVLLYYQDKNVSDGFYCVVDVGGGTVDIAVFYKQFIDWKTEVSCVAHAVVPLGFEALIESVSPDPGDERSRDRLAHLSVPYSVLGHTGRMNETPGIKSKPFEDAVHKFELAVGRHCLYRVLTIMKSQVQSQMEHGHDLSLFMLGGGRDVQLYHDVIRHMSAALKAAGFLEKSNCDILDYVRAIDRFDEKENSRVLISQMLAQPFNEIPKLDGSFWKLSQLMNHDIPATFDIQSRLPISVGRRVRCGAQGAGYIEKIDETEGSFDVVCDNGVRLCFANPQAFESGSVKIVSE